VPQESKFEVPKEVDNFLRELSSLVGLLWAWEDSKANRSPEDYSGWLVGHLFELYGALQLAGFAFGQKCPAQITKLLADFRDSFEEVIHYLYHGEPEAQKAIVLHADGVLTKMEIALFTLAVACARATPEDLKELSVEARPDN
jgi:hypothetical protein